MEFDSLYGRDFRTVLADPPWAYNDKLDSKGKIRGAANHYDCLSINEIKGFEVYRATLANAHLYLCTTNAFLEHAFSVMRAWGFSYVTTITWCKPGLGMGHHYRNTSEHVLFGVRGKLPVLRKNQPTHFIAKKSKHSKKPEELFSIIESMSPGPYLEMFSREEREGWTVWGNEVNAAN